MTLLLFVAPAFLAAVLAFVLTPVARRLAFVVGAVDDPGPRKVHTLPTPRLGGLAVVAAIGIVLATIVIVAPSSMHRLNANLLAAAAAGLVPIFIISFIDDIRPQRAFTKLLFHTTGAIIAVTLGVRLNEVVHFFGYEVTIGWIAIPISILWLTGLTNAFNIVDGLDGLSAGLALIATVSLAAVSVVTNRYDLAAAAGVLAGALVGFLPYNIYPAKVYLGDTGAAAIGFFLGCLALAGGSTMSSGLAITLPLLVIGVPVAETLISMLRRTVKRSGGALGMFQADSEHFHHRLLALGYSHQRAVYTLYGAGLLLAAFGFASVFLKHQDAALLLGVLLVAAIVGIGKLGYDEFALIKRGVVLEFYKAPVLRRSLFVAFVDLGMVICALYVSIGLKYDDWAVRDHRELVFSLIALLPATTVGLFALLQMYRQTWSKANVGDMVRLTAAVVVSTIGTYVIARMTAPNVVSITFIITYTLVLLAFIVGSRASYRVLYHWNRVSNRDGEPIVIYGAGAAGTAALRLILSNSDLLMRPIGFIDDDPAKHGRFVNGLPVLGDLAALAKVLLDGRAKGVVIASHKISFSKMQSAKEVCESRGAWTRVFKADFHSLTTEAI